MTTIGPPRLPTNIPDSAGSRHAGDVADVPPAARPVVDNGHYAVPAPSARYAFQRDVLTLLPTVRQPAPLLTSGQDAVRHAEEADHDPQALRSAVSTVNGGGRLLARFASPLQRVLMRDNAAEPLPRLLVEAQSASVPGIPGGVPSPAAMAALLAHLPTMPPHSGWRARRTPDDALRETGSDDEAEQAEAARQAALARTRVCRRV